MKKTKKIILTVLAVALICTVSVVGTLAYLNSKSEKVSNTFVANGKIVPTEPTIDPQTTPMPTPVAPDEPEEHAFYLVETKAKLAEDGLSYVLDNSGSPSVYENKYEKIVPGMELEKNPTLNYQVADDAKAYIYLQVVDADKNLEYELTDDWMKTDLVGEKDATVYVYKDGAVQAESGKMLMAKVLDKDKVTVKNLTLEDNAEVDLGKLEFIACICQAQGFEDYKDAWNKVFAPKA